MKKQCLVLAALILFLLTAPSEAQIPRTLSYQGVLTDNAGKPRPDGDYSFTFQFYTSPTGGTAIWSESKSLSVKNGLFSTELGKQTPFGAAVKFDQQYWLGIQVGDEPELSPRIALTSVGYSFSSLRADTASVSVASLADTTWRHSGANIYRLNGNVGIGTANPTSKLAVAGIVRVQDNLLIEASGVGATPILDFNSGFGNKSGVLFRGNGSSANRSMALRLDQSLTSRLTIAQSNFNPNPDLQTGWADLFTFENDRLSIEASGAGSTPILDFNSGFGNKIGVLFRGNGSNANQSMALRLDQGPTSRLTVAQSNFNPNHDLRTGWNDLVTFESTGNVGIGTPSPTSRLHVEGTTTTRVLAITGGSDLAEPFEISESQPIRKGALVIIDEENPGQLKLSHQAYDKRVAGVVSGAGGINPGLTLSQEGVLEGGQNVALSGRVYALATAANGPIKPGDLLTTSEVSGHAMKSTDVARSNGTIIGKAMSSLEQGEGLVLVLVNLQ